MLQGDAVDRLFSTADLNRDGRIDKTEFRNLLHNSGISTADDWYNDPNQYPHSYRGPVRLPNDYAIGEPVKSSGIEETTRYLQRLGSSVYVDPNPTVVRRNIEERPMTYEQRVLVRCLQPPPISTADPLIIKEVRPPQPLPPPPVVIREHETRNVQQAPLYLRERPPAPPPRGQGETIIRHLPPVPVPPRSLVVERYPNYPGKPRDIIIEQWLPYPEEPNRPTIIQPAPAPIKYPAPTHTVVLYDAAKSTVKRKFERLGITQEDPETYITRYGTTLLDPDTLLQRARSVGVFEDISCLCTPVKPKPPPPEPVKETMPSSN